MPCYSPIAAYRGDKLTENGKREIVFSLKDAGRFRGNDVLKVPCGRCIGCRLERSRQWAIRCMHEAQLYDDNCFITLTYNNDNLPVNGSLCKRDFQLFMKRLRRRFGNGIRFFHCGEYGSALSRPHYHACLFNFDFPDKEKYYFKNGCWLFRSTILERLWTKGFSLIGEVTFESAAYVARYVMKKWYGEDADHYYNGKVPEYVTMSRRPGIGHDWFKKFKDDVYPHDYVIVNGMKCRPPKYYDSMFDLTNPEQLCILKEKRKEVANVNPDNTKERLKDQFTVKSEQVKMLRRHDDIERI